MRVEQSYKQSISILRNEKVLLKADRNNFKFRLTEK